MVLTGGKEWKEEEEASNFQVLERSFPLFECVSNKNNLLPKGVEQLVHLGPALDFINTIAQYESLYLMV